MISKLIWWLPVLAAVFFMISLTYLAKAGSKLNRQAQKVNRRFSKFQAGLPTVLPKATEQPAPTLAEARLARKNYLKDKVKRREARQRRLVKHLRDLQGRESE